MTRNLKDLASDVGFLACGITNPDFVSHLFYDWIGKIRKMKTPQEDFPDVKSIIILTQAVWDDSLSLSIYPPEWKGYGMHSPDESFETFYAGYELMRRKAQFVIDYLQENGFASKISFDIPLKTTAVVCGLGAQGKNTLLVNPERGPRVMLVGILTDAVLNIDSPFTEDLCGECTRCIDACPTKALEPYKLTFNRCMTYSAESPCSPDVPVDVREKESKLVKRPTANSFIDCSICMNVCPIGKTP